jgi:hypothetical protein
MTAKQKADVLLDALKQIREVGYNSTAARCPDTVLACIRLAEAAISNVETKEARWGRQPNERRLANDRQ